MFITRSKEYHWTVVYKECVSATGTSWFFILINIFTREVLERLPIAINIVCPMVFTDGIQVRYIRKVACWLLISIPLSF